MLAIMIDTTNEWWVSGATFERLFQSALNMGVMPPAMAAWRHEADANGGIYLPDRDPAEAKVFVEALRHAAEHDLSNSIVIELESQDETYRVSLRKLLDVLRSSAIQPDPTSCPAGQVCPRTGFWATPARVGSRQRFERGETMPALEGDYGATVWHWDEQQ